MVTRSSKACAPCPRSAADLAPAIALTAYARDEDHARALQAGFSEVIWPNRSCPPNSSRPCANWFIDEFASLCVALANVETTTLGGVCALFQTGFLVKLFGTPRKPRCWSLCTQEKRSRPTLVISSEARAENSIRPRGCASSVHLHVRTLALFPLARRQKISRLVPRSK